MLPEKSNTFHKSELYVHFQNHEYMYARFFESSECMFPENPIFSNCMKTIVFNPKTGIVTKEY